jgi:hypothetical protein
MNIVAALELAATFERILSQNWRLLRQYALSALKSKEGLPRARHRANMGQARRSKMTETSQPSRSRPAFVVVASSSHPKPGDGKKGQENRAVSQVSFDRREFALLFNLYGAKVAAGEWRDYALDFTPAKAIFSIFRFASEAPLYRIEKNPELARKQGAYAVVAASGLVLRRGHDLSRVLRALDRGLRLVVAD